MFALAGDETGCGVDLVLGDDNESLASDKIKQAPSQLEEIFSITNVFALTGDDVLIHYRNKLGEGAFCNVYPAHIRNGKTGNFDESMPPFALKKLRHDIISHQNPNVLARAYEDLAGEAHIMKKLRHDHIIHMLGSSSDEGTAKDKFFVVLEKLESTLDKKLEKWAKIRGPFRQITPKDTVMIRINEVALAIARGLDYIHSQHYIYRDLKPANIGFDHSGRVKIFDFGLTVHVPKNNMVKGQAGTVRYMAPEMKGGKEYGYSVDVYSYTILLWQMITSRVPFEKEIPESDFFAPADMNMNCDIRPNLKYVENKDLTALLEMSWKTNPDERWTLGQILPELQRIGKEMGIPSERPSSGRGRRRFISSMNNY
jgi:serine/threonine protein kinase